MSDNELGAFLAFTTGYERLTRPMGMLDADEPNIAAFVFTDPRARTAYPEWDAVADEHAAALRTEASLGDPHAAGLIEHLSIMAGTPFTDRMDAPPDLPRPAAVQRLVHPEVGELRLSTEVMELTGGEQRLVVYLPGDDATSSALDRLAGRKPGALRAVNA